MEIMVLKVAAASNPAIVAGAVANNVRERKRVEMVAMGAAAVNQAVKALAIARDYLSRESVDLVCRPEFIHLTIDGEKKSALKLVVFFQEY
jgi:stage V sporulation protein S